MCEDFRSKLKEDLNVIQQLIEKVVEKMGSVIFDEQSMEGFLPKDLTYYASHLHIDTTGLLKKVDQAINWWQDSASEEQDKIEAQEKRLQETLAQFQTQLKSVFVNDTRTLTGRTNLCGHVN